MAMMRGHEEEMGFADKFRGMALSYIAEPW